jgi:hypothetical protein
MKKALQRTRTKKPAVLTLRKETLRHWVTGGSRIHIPGGFDGNTNPIYIWVDDTLS